MGLDISNISLINIRELALTKKSAEKYVEVHFLDLLLELSLQWKKKQE